MSHQVDPDELVKRAAEDILGDAGLRDELTDGEAQPLIDWGLAQATALARSAAALPDAEPVVDEGLKGLRRLMKRINRFIGLRAYHDPDALAVELDRLRVVSAKLYGERPSLLPDDAARYVLVDEIEGMGNDQVVVRLLALFGPQTGAASLDGVMPADAAAPTGDPAPAEPQAPQSPTPRDPHVPEHLEPPAELQAPPVSTPMPPAEPHAPQPPTPPDPHVPEHLEPPAELQALPVSAPMPPAEPQAPLVEPDRPDTSPEDEPRFAGPLAGLLRLLGRAESPDDDESEPDAPPGRPSQEG